MKRSGWGPKQKERACAESSKQKDIGASSHVVGLHRRNVVSNTATATIRSRGRLPGDQTALLTQACRCEAFKYQRCYYENKMLVRVLDGTEGKSFLAPEFRPLCSSLAGWLAGAHDGFFHFLHYLADSLLHIQSY